MSDNVLKVTSKKSIDMEQDVLDKSQLLLIIMFVFPVLHTMLKLAELECSMEMLLMLSRLNQSDITRLHTLEPCSDFNSILRIM